MQQPTITSGRKKFLLWAATLLPAFALLKWLPAKAKKNTEPVETVKMLTQDGKLVEIDKKLLTGPGNRISNDELQHWIRKNNNQQSITCQPPTPPGASSL